MKIFMTNDIPAPFFALTLLSIAANDRSSGHRVFMSKILLLEQLVSLVVLVIGLDGGGECITGGKSP